MTGSENIFATAVGCWNIVLRWSLSLQKSKSLGINGPTKSLADPINVSLQLKSRAQQYLLLNPSNCDNGFGRSWRFPMGWYVNYVILKDGAMDSLTFSQMSHRGPKPNQLKTKLPSLERAQVCLSLIR
jgi:hypothetical protein